MITVRLSGGLGNQMFEYAAARALALRHGTDLRLDLTYLHDRTWRPKSFRITFRNYDLDVFSVSATIAESKDTPIHFLGTIGLYLDLAYRRLCKPKGAERHYQFDPAVLLLPDNTYLDGGWQSPKYFAGHEEQIRKDFSFAHEPSSEAIRVLGTEIAAAESLCVHVRRADFIGNALHEVCDAEYYDRGLAEIEKRGKIASLYVFSDDIAWCREHMRFDYPTVFVGNEYAGVKNVGQLFLMSQCKYFVIANSSFSWWAAWLSKRPGKVVVAPRRWFADDSIDTRDVTPDDWIRI